ncbi:MAG: hypothetical protein HOQ22_01265 [Nocardioidaceae bacterium]|nr:hypothetical protein [Nocardioidaceae bacterium]NUS49657.1 hypothetical protein [Nocardioidaceae bacterium]
MPLQHAYEAPFVTDQRSLEVAEPVLWHDHVTSHSIKCYWDYLECRWECRD